MHSEFFSWPSFVCFQANVIWPYFFGLFLLAIMSLDIYVYCSYPDKSYDLDEAHNCIWISSNPTIKNFDSTNYEKEIKTVSGSILAFFGENTLFLLIYYFSDQYYGKRNKKFKSFYKFFHPRTMLRSHVINNAWKKPSRA